MFSDFVGTIVFIVCIIVCIGFPNWLEAIL